MCGICGVLRFDGQPVSGTVDEALAALRHRGPDHAGTWTFQGPRVSATLGAARLAVLDPRHEADQPYHRDGRFHLIYNGELYNFRQLRAELVAMGEAFSTHGDTEVVLAACARWGPDALPRFDGMWALAFFDSKEQSGFLARDRIGIKPLLYAVSGSELCFASEMRGLTALRSWRKEIDAGTVLQHLVFGYIADPGTIYRSAWRVPPGHVLGFGPNGLSEPRRYAPLYGKPQPQANYNSARAGLRRLIGDAVSRQRVSDVPIGAFLSGGIDSSIVATHLAECTAGPLRTFCVGYADQRSYDEREYARIVAGRIGSRHEEVVLSQTDVLAAIPKILDHLGEPVGDSSIVPTSLVSGVARRFVTVALSGDGGDELFGGYWRYLAHQALEKYLRIPGLLRQGLIEPVLALLAVSRSSSLGNRIRQLRKLTATASRDALVRHAAWSRILPSSAENLFVDPALVQKCVQSMVEKARHTVDGGSDPLNQLLQFDVQHQLPADMLHKVDLASMSHSLEVRVPLLDGAIVEAVSPLPSSYKIYRGLRKRILVDAYRGHLPDEILDRAKQGFEVPIGELLRGPLRSLFHDVVRKETIESFSLLSHAAVSHVYAEHCHKRADYADLLWSILSLCWWKQRKISAR